MFVPFVVAYGGRCGVGGGLFVLVWGGVMLGGAGLVEMGRRRGAS